MEKAPDAKAGAGFEAIVAAYHAEIHRYLCRVTSRQSDAEDLSQETFLRAYRAWATLPPDADARAWLYTIATNVYRNHSRSERRRRVALTAVCVVRREIDSDDPEVHVGAGEIRSLVEAGLRALPLKQRLAFTMRKFQQLEYETIGRSLECSEDAARAHVFQALRKLRKTLDGHVFRSSRSKP